MTTIRKFNVTTRDGREFMGYTHLISTSPYVMGVFKTAFRRVSSHLGNYIGSNPETALDFCDLLGVVVDPITVVPRNETEVAIQSLPYGLTRIGTWWQKVEVEYIQVPSSIKVQLP